MKSFYDLLNDGTLTEDAILDAIKSTLKDPKFILESIEVVSTREVGPQDVMRVSLGEPAPDVHYNRWYIYTKDHEFGRVRVIVFRVPGTQTMMVEDAYIVDEFDPLEEAI